MERDIIRWWRVDLGNLEATGVTDALMSGWLTMGPLCEDLESRLASFLGVESCVLMNNGASAIAAALMACGVGPGDEVVIPGLTFIATANAARLLGARVRLVDVAKDRPVLDPDALEMAIGPRTKVVVPVHLGGRGVDMDRVLEVASFRGARVVEDAAQALGSRGKGGFLGTLADIGCFSLGITKLVTTGEGGVAVATNPGMDRLLRRIRNNGTESLADNRFETTGMNFRPLDLLSGLGLVRVDCAERSMKRLRSVYQRYREGLKGLHSVRLIGVDIDAGELPLWVEVLAADQDAIIGGLAERGIEAKPYPSALCEIEPLGCPDPLPRALYFARHGVILPSGPDRSDEEVDRVLDVLANLDRRLGLSVPAPPQRKGQGRIITGATLHNPDLFRRDDTGRSIAFFARRPVRDIDSGLIQELESVAREGEGIARICLHASPSDTLHDMVIVKTRQYPGRPMKHPGADQIYHVIRGRLAVIIFDDEGGVLDAVALDPDSRPILRIPPDRYYIDVPITETVVFHEILPGPYDAADRIEASWWPTDDDGQKVRHRIDELTELV